MDQKLLHRVAIVTLPLYGFGVTYDALAETGVLPKQPVDLTPPAVFSVSGIASTTTATATTLLAFTVSNPITGDEIAMPSPQTAKSMFRATMG